MPRARVPEYLFTVWEVVIMANSHGPYLGKPVDDFTPMVEKLANKQKDEEAHAAAMAGYKPLAPPKPGPDTMQAKVDRLQHQETELRIRILELETAAAVENAEIVYLREVVRRLTGAGL